MNTIVALVEYLFDSSRPVRCEYCEHYDYCSKSGSMETTHTCEPDPQWSSQIKQKFIETIQCEIDNSAVTDSLRTAADLIADSCIDFVQRPDGFKILDDRLSHKLTSDTMTDALAANYAGLLEHIADYNASYEYYIKLNRYERRDTPMLVDRFCTCPVCGSALYDENQQFCSNCGQRLRSVNNGDT